MQQSIASIKPPVFNKASNVTPKEKFLKKLFPTIYCTAQLHIAVMVLEKFNIVYLV